MPRTSHPPPQNPPPPVSLTAPAGELDLEWDETSVEWEDRPVPSNTAPPANPSDRVTVVPPMPVQEFVALLMSGAPTSEAPAGTSQEPGRLEGSSAAPTVRRPGLVPGVPLEAAGEGAARSPSERAAAIEGEPLSLDLYETPVTPPQPARPRALPELDPSRELTGSAPAPAVAAPRALSPQQCPATAAAVPREFSLHCAAGPSSPLSLANSMRQPPPTRPMGELELASALAAPAWTGPSEDPTLPPTLPPPVTPPVTAPPVTQPSAVAPGEREGLREMRVPLRLEDSLQPPVAGVRIDHTAGKPWADLPLDSSPPTAPPPEADKPAQGAAAATPVPTAQADPGTEPPPSAPPAGPRPNATAPGIESARAARRRSLPPSASFGSAQGDALELVAVRATSSVPPSEAVDLDRARDRFDVGDFSGALAIAEAVLEGEPENADAMLLAEHCRDVLKQMYISRLGGLPSVPRPAMAPEQLRWLSLDHRAGFVLSLVDGHSSIDEVLDMSGMSDLDALRILFELVQQNVIRMG